MSELRLDTPVQYVKGVGPKRAEQLAPLGIQTLQDLLLYFPFRFDLRKQAQSIASLSGNEASVTVAGEVQAVSENRHARTPYFQAQLQDETGWLFVKWFHGGYLRDKIKPGLQLAVSGKVGLYREHLQIVNPKMQFLWGDGEDRLDKDELLPVYPAGGKLTSQIIGRIIRNALPGAQGLIQEWFRPEFRDKRGLLRRDKAVGAMHHPEDREQWKMARRRFAYEECLLMQLGIALMRMREVSRPAHPLLLTERIDKRIRRRFPFAMTEAQNNAVAEIAADMGREKPMNRLLQGDVGSGKTVAALYAALLAVARKKQVAIMAPTEILADQHFRKIRQYLADSKVRTELLVGSQNPQQRKRVLNGLAVGDIHIVVGTHALLSEGVKFAALALVVVDEQHKFGVRQRTGIRAKGFAPHYLVMTATPIPRTLAMTVFGDLDVSVIDKLPPGRGEILTRTASMDDLDDVYAEVAGLLDSGQQAYFVYPLVNASDSSDLKSAQEQFEQLRTGPFGNYRLGLLHGQMSQDRKDTVMASFRNGQTQLLIASVVVEVGVDVPNANVMVVHHAERFGLAQLHQLRGRIGRSEQDARCILVASAKTENARKRMEILTRTRDGFKIAEEDLRLRGPGEFFGTRQHGLPELRIADLIEDFDLLRLARRDAFEMVREDPGLNAPHHQRIRARMIEAYAGKLDLLGGA